MRSSPRAGTRPGPPTEGTQVSIAGLLGSSRGRQAAAVAVAAVLIGGGLAACSRPDAPVPVADGFGGDGLSRYVVTLADDGSGAPGASGLPSGLPSDGPTIAPPATPAAEGSTVPGPMGVRGRLDVGLLAHAHAVLGLGGQLIAVGTDPYYVADGGAMLVGPGGDGSVLEGGAPSLVAAPADADVAGGEPDAAGPSAENLLATLSARPGVAGAQRLADGTVLVATGLTEDELAAFPEVADVVPSTEERVLG